MASDLSPYMGNIILRWLNGDAAMPSSPTNRYLALFNGNPKTTGTEVSLTIDSGGRKIITFGALASGVDHILTSNADVDFGDSEGAAALSYYALMDASTGGHLIASKAIPGGPLAIVVGTGVKFLAGNVTFNIGSDT